MRCWCRWCVVDETVSWWTCGYRPEGVPVSDLHDMYACDIGLTDREGQRSSAFADNRCIDCVLADRQVMHLWPHITWMPSRIETLSTLVCSARARSTPLLGTYIANFLTAVNTFRRSSRYGKESMSLCRTFENASCSE